MKLEGTTSIHAPIEKVWSVLVNPDQVSQCAPGLVSMEVIEPNQRFKALAGVGFGSVKLTFDVDVEFVELAQPSYARMKAHGKTPGSGVDINADMHLSNGQDGTTALDWAADVVVVGTIASMASRLMSGLTQKLTSEFFDCVKEKIEA